ncbi:O-antigen/teichoic acid export membrane protein [Flavobacterium araucananum]|uniref:Polysaccharide biosynthesis protein n=1 Tax=Flavobacterium araucananum TaxID=946678 RepID=A0A227P6T5_9FLAO|nr:polysaccharide biosynthesis C-terminal domain-containing protein [Flavobacterium araucananum]OXG05619.1 polysaccharide biosynthesis protein [Flavobacterium araucananum]PWK02413.1 O-antigen/teichoic acid export membrane protein [Flavobacterium araucananum]
MSLYKKLFKQTAIYGLATVLPKMFSFILVPLYTNLLPKTSYGEITEIFAYMIFFNIILSYGMETVFFRFFNTESDKKNVIETSMVSIFWTTICFLFSALLFRNTISQIFEIDVEYITFAIWILSFDALVIIPFSKLRANQKAKNYSIIKIGSVAINLILNVFFLKYLPIISSTDPNGILSNFYFNDFQIGYILLSNIISSLLTFIILLPHYFNLNWKFDFNLWKRMMRYGFPILIAGIAFAINDQFDKILLAKILPKSIAESQVGIYAACYKLGLFMVLYRTAYTLGIEPFFFSHASNKNAPQTYALITKYFVIFGSFILLIVIVFVDILKTLMIRDSSYWEAMGVVPLIILANFFLGIYTNLSVWYKLINKTYIGAYISVIGAILTLIINFALIPTMSYYGSAIATLIAYASMMLISYYLGNKYYPIPYDKKKILSYLSISIVFSIISFYCFRENYYIGTSLLIVYLYIIYRNEKNIIFLILKIRKNQNPS